MSTSFVISGTNQGIRRKAWAGLTRPERGDHPACSKDVLGDREDGLIGGGGGSDVIASEYAI